jgi:hypothetical protein
MFLATRMSGALRGSGGFRARLSRWGHTTAPPIAGTRSDSCVRRARTRDGRHLDDVADGAVARAPAEGREAVAAPAAVGRGVPAPGQVPPPCDVAEVPRRRGRTRAPRRGGRRACARSGAGARGAAEQLLVELPGCGDVAAGVAELDARVADPHGAAVEPRLLGLVDRRLEAAALVRRHG